MLQLLFPDDNAAAASSAPTINEEDLQQLISMGFDPDLCRYALEDARNSGSLLLIQIDRPLSHTFSEIGVEQATMWLFDNGSNPEVLEKIASKKAAQSNSGNSSVEAVPNDIIELIGSMGFSVAQARYALKETSNAAERAVDWLFSHPDFDCEDVPSNSNEKCEESESAGDAGSGLYELFGVVQHRGTSASSGHYVAYIKIGRLKVFYDVLFSSLLLQRVAGFSLTTAKSQNHSLHQLVKVICFSFDALSSKDRQ